VMFAFFLSFFLFFPFRFPLPFFFFFRVEKCVLDFYKLREQTIRWTPAPLFPLSSPSPLPPSFLFPFLSSETGMGKTTLLFTAAALESYVISVSSPAPPSLSSLSLFSLFFFREKKREESTCSFLPTLPLFSFSLLSSPSFSFWRENRSWKKQHCRVRVGSMRQTPALRHSFTLLFFFFFFSADTEC